VERDTVYNRVEKMTAWEIALLGCFQLEKAT
jgi:hypothetical protein